MKNKNAKWEHWCNLVFGAWVFIIPWSLGSGLKLDQSNAISWNFILIGVGVMGSSIASLKNIQVWEEWINLFLGVWLFLSPWLLFYSHQYFLLINSLLFGVLIIAMALGAIPVAEKVERMRENKLKNLKM